MAEIIMELNNVSKEYFGGYIGIKNASFDVKKGERISILGKEGAGKSTLLKTMCGLEKASGGSVLYKGRDIASFDAKDTSIVFVTGELGLFRRKTVYKNLTYSSEIRGNDLDDVNARVGEIAEVFGITDILGVKADMLSEIQTAYVMLARGFMRKADIYLFDSPLSAFPNDIRSDALKLFSAAANRLGGAVVYATDRSEEACAIGGGKCVVLESGFMRDVGGIYGMYRRPRSLSSARLLSGGAYNEINALLTKEGEAYRATFSDVGAEVGEPVNDVYVGKEIIVAFPPEAVECGVGAMNGTVVDLFETVRGTYVKMDCGGTRILGLYDGVGAVEKYGAINFRIKKEMINLYDAAAERIISKEKGK